MRPRWAFWFAAMSLPITLIIAVLVFEYERMLRGGMFTLATTLVAAITGWLAEGERWALRSVVGTLVGGALYGSLVAFVVAPPLFLVGTVVGLGASVLYVPFLSVAAAAAESSVVRWQD